MSAKLKRRFVYLVYCNPEPIVYAVYSNKKKALEYAHHLVKWRRLKAEEKGFIFGKYHEVSENSRKETDHDFREKLIYSTCLMIKDTEGNKIETPFSDDGCFVKVVRRNISI